MSRSSAQKKLAHKLRQNPTGHDPRNSRGSWHGVKPISKVRPGKRKYDIKDRDSDVAPFDNMNSAS